MSAWRDQAACAGMDTEDFYPPSGAGGPIQAAAAISVCKDCPVRVECLDAAMCEEYGGQAYGVRGGLTADDRMALARRTRRFQRVVTATPRERPGPPRIPSGSKNCEVCGKAFTRRENEALNGFRARKTCDLTCRAYLINANRRAKAQGA